MRRWISSRCGRRSLRIELLEARRLLVGDLVNSLPWIDLLQDQASSEGSLFSLSAAFADANDGQSHTVTIDWGDGHESVGTVQTVDLPEPDSPLNIRVDFTHDDFNFFDTPEKRDLVQFAADLLVERLGDDLAAISPSGNNTWQAIFIDPADADEQIQLMNLEVAENEIIIFAGGQQLGGSLALGGPGGFSVNGTQSFVDTVSGRGESGALLPTPTDYGPWGGIVTFDIDANWHFGTDTLRLEDNQADFFSVAVHELTHALGFGTSDAFSRWVDDSQYTGPASVAEFDGPGNPPLHGDNAHWQNGVTDEGREAALDPSITLGTRKLLTELDFAALDDLGWDLLAQGGISGTISGQHTYADDGQYTVTVTISDGLDTTQQTFVVDVANSVPVLTAAPSQQTLAGQPLTIVDLVQFSDAGFDNPLDSPPTTETFSFTIDWGDGTPQSAGTAPIDNPGSPAAPTTGSVAATHTYANAGQFTITVTIEDDDGGVASDTVNVEVMPTAQVVDRRVFYNATVFDGHDAGPGVSDDGAIAPSPEELTAAGKDSAWGKQALLPGQSAGFMNLTSFEAGITGVILDVADLADPNGLSAADFAFRVGNSNDLDGSDGNPDNDWVTAPAPQSITVREGEGKNGSDRVTLIWPAGAIRNRWLEIQMLPTAATGLIAADTHYWGNLVGESGDDPEAAELGVPDSLRVRRRGATGAIESPLDYNRDGQVNSEDARIARDALFAGAGPFILLDLSSTTAPATAPVVAAQNGADENGEFQAESASLPAIEPARSTTAAFRTALRLQRVNDSMRRSPLPDGMDTLGDPAYAVDDNDLAEFEALEPTLLARLAWAISTRRS